MKKRVRRMRFNNHKDNTKIAINELIFRGFSSLFFANCTLKIEDLDDMDLKQKEELQSSSSQGNHRNQTIQVYFILSLNFFSNFSTFGLTTYWQYGCAPF